MTDQIQEIQNQMQQRLSELENQVVVIVGGEMQNYPLDALNLTFEDSTDAEIMDAVKNVLRESQNIEMPEGGDFVVERNTRQSNVVIFPKTDLGGVNMDFIDGEISRSRKRLGNTRKRIKVVDYDIHDNFTSVILSNGNGKSAIGYAKVNPNYDEPNSETGLSIATFRAMRRLLGK